MGAVEMFALIVWIITTGWRAWSRRDSDLARAASIGTAVIAVIAVVSWVDYPLRTESLAVLFAFFLAAMTPSSRARSA